MLTVCNRAALPAVSQQLLAHTGCTQKTNHLYKLYNTLTNQTEAPVFPLLSISYNTAAAAADTTLTRTQSMKQDNCCNHLHD